MPLDPSRLSARIRDVLRGNPGSRPTADVAVPLEESGVGDAPIREIRFVPDADDAMAPEVPGGCVVLDRDYPSYASHGRATVGEYADALAGHLPWLATLAADAAPAPASDRPGALEFEPSRRMSARPSRTRTPTEGPLLFFDLETTGLSGGVGTVAFLVGCGYFTDDGFRTRQFFLSGYDAEADMLRRLSALARQFAGLVTFNGRTFDVPLIDMRYAFHRLDSPFETMPHFDMLHPARRLWRRREPLAADDTGSCALKTLEEAVLGTGRVGDVPGFEIPGRYFGYLRSGDVEPLQAVFEHNRLDLLSLAALTAHASRLAGEGPDTIPSPHEALALAVLYELAGRAADAEACLVRASGAAGSPWDPATIALDVRVDAIKRLALLRRRQRRHDEAAGAWELLLRVARDRATIREARQALAVHLEHRARDLGAARRMAERALATERDPERAAALRHRLDRLARKGARASGVPSDPLP